MAPALVAAVSVLLVAAGIGAFLLLRAPSGSPSQVAAPATAPERTAPGQGSPQVVTEATPYVSPQSGPTDRDESDYGSGRGSADVAWNLQSLRSQATHDRTAAESLVGYWLPQVSSKKVGTDGYDTAAIAEDYRNSVAARPDTRFLLVVSDEYTSFAGSGYWVTLAARPFGTAQAANTWCDAQGYGRNDCYAKRLSHSEGPAGNTQLRR